MTVAHCIECGKKLSQNNIVEYACPDGHMYYNNPAIGVVLIFQRGDKILFSRRAHEPQKGKWDIPGGFVDPGETLEEAAIREAKEELGITVTSLRYIASNPNLYTENTYVCDAHFLVTEWEGELVPDDDVSEIEWKDLDTMLQEDFSWTNWSAIYQKIKAALK
jgi:mutator protein MutT